MATYYSGSGMGGPRRFTLFPPMIKALLISNVVVFLLQIISETIRLGGIPLSAYINRYLALWPFESGLLYPWQFITYQFMHGGWMHLFFNMFALWMFGVELESVWGAKRFLIYYLLCGIGAGLIHLGVSSLLGESGYMTVGASGAIYGILLAFGLTFPDRPIIMFPIFFPVPARIFVLIYAGIELIAGFSNTSSGVAHFAHLGGAAVGFFLLKFGDTLGIYGFFDKIAGLLGKTPKNSSFHKRRRIYRVDAGQRDTTSAPPWFRTAPPSEPTQPQSSERLFEPTQEITQEQIDRILDKISRFGYNSLTEAEKQTLYEASKKF